MVCLRVLLLLQWQCGHCPVWKGTLAAWMVGKDFMQSSICSAAAVPSPPPSHVLIWNGAALHSWQWCSGVLKCVLFGTPVSAAQAWMISAVLAVRFLSLLFKCLQFVRTNDNCCKGALKWFSNTIDHQCWKTDITICITVKGDLGLCCGIRSSARQIGKNACLVVYYISRHIQTTHLAVCHEFVKELVHPQSLLPLLRVKHSLPFCC